MTRDEYLSVMQFPADWIGLGMVPPDEWLSRAIESYDPGHEQSPEHDRYGAFQYWLKRGPSKEQLQALVRLSFADPDSAMAGQVREEIARASTFDDDVRRQIEDGDAA